MNILNIESFTSYLPLPQLKKEMEEKISPLFKRIFDSSLCRCLLQKRWIATILVVGIAITFIFLKITKKDSKNTEKFNEINNKPFDSEKREEKTEFFFKEKKFFPEKDFHLQLENCTEDDTTSSLFIKDEKGNSSKHTLKLLGKGGSKKAFSIGDGKALIVPNLSVDTTSYRIWERIICEETGMSKLLTSLGLLSLQLTPVTISLTEEGPSFPTYVCQSFESLAQNNCFIIDTKNRESTTWEGKFFKTEEDGMKSENWDPIFDPLLTDIAIICVNNIPTPGDSQNVAIIKKGESYEARYFGFDFSSKRQPLAIPKKASSIDSNKMRVLLSNYLEYILDKEFGNKLFSYDYPKDLFESLKERYEKIILEKIEKLKI